MIAIQDTINGYRNMYSDVPKNDDIAIRWIIMRIKHNSSPSTKSKLTRHFVKVDNGVTYEDTLDTYYVNFINDTLEGIRGRDGYAYVFSFDHIKEILRFEPTAQFTYLPDDKCFKVTLGYEKGLGF